MQQPRTILEKLGLSASEVDVFLALANGAASARDVMRVTRQKRPTVYYALDSLAKRGLLRKSGSEGKAPIALEPLDRLAIIAAEKLRESEKLVTGVEEIIPTLETKNPGLKDGKPSVAFFEGVEAVKNVIMESLYCKKREIFSVVPSRNRNFFWQVGEYFVEQYVSERVERGIKTKNLWEEPTTREIFKKYYGGFSDIRILPGVMRGAFSTTVFLYDDKTLYVSSLGNSNCILVTSKEHHDTMRAWFSGLWTASAKHPEF